MIRASDIKELLDLQVATNVAYFGENWRDVWTEVSSVNSIYREWAEFLDEVTRDWKVYDPKPVFDKTKAVYELVDVVHFMLCNILLSDQLRLDNMLRVFGADVQVESFPTELEAVTEQFSYFMVENKSVYRLTRFLAVACSYLEISFETYLKAHKRKNDRNRARAAGGVLQGKYDKSTEQPLTLEF